MLRLIKIFIKVYINDIVSGIKLFEKYVGNLRELFNILIRYNIVISLKKTFLGYLSITLLGRKVNSLGLATSVDKLTVISKLSYPEILSKLKYYLGLIGYLRNYIYFYT